MAKPLRTLAAWLIVMAACLPSAAQNYPIRLIPGQSWENKVDKTEWVLSEEQFKKTIEKAKLLEISDSLVVAYERKVENLEAQIGEKNSIIALMREKEASYERQITASEEHAFEMRREALRQARMKTFALLGIPVALLIGFLVN